MSIIRSFAAIAALLPLALPAHAEQTIPIECGKFPPECAQAHCVGDSHGLTLDADGRTVLGTEVCSVRIMNDAEYAVFMSPRAQGAASQLGAEDNLRWCRNNAQLCYRQEYDSKSGKYLWKTIPTTPAEFAAMRAAHPDAIPASAPNPLDQCMSQRPEECRSAKCGVHLGPRGECVWRPVE